MRKKLTVAITGATGKVANALIFRLASGQAFGTEIDLELHLLDLEQTMPILNGIKMELEDCAFPRLKKIICTSDVNQGMGDINWAILIGSAPRTIGMQRGDLIKINAEIFKTQGQAINKNASSNVKVLVAGNPCNTNCLVAMNNAKNIAAQNFYALTTLDENRARFQLANKVKAEINSVHNLAIWGNHSALQFPDFYHAKINNLPVIDIIQDEKWLQTEFLTKVRNRGTEILNTKGSSSTASAANGIIDALWHLTHETKIDQFFSMACCSNGEYDIDPGLIYSFPCRTENGNLKIVPNLEHNQFATTEIQNNLEELRKERDAVLKLGLI